MTNNTSTHDIDSNELFLPDLRARVLEACKYTIKMMHIAQICLFSIFEYILNTLFLVRMTRGSRGNFKRPEARDAGDAVMLQLSL